jgi:hypothetical protein
MRPPDRLELLHGLPQHSVFGSVKIKNMRYIALTVGLLFVSGSVLEARTAKPHVIKAKKNKVKAHKVKSHARAN